MRWKKPKERTILGTIIYCKHCNHIWAEQYRSEPFPWNDGMIADGSPRPQYTEIGDLICEDCVKERNFRILTEEDNEIVNAVDEQESVARKTYEQRMKEIKENFRKTITPEFLEKINPEAVECYKENRGNRYAEREYVEKIRSWLHIYLHESIDIMIKSDECYQRERHLLRDMERELRNFLVEIEKYPGLCEQILLPIKQKRRKKKEREMPSLWKMAKSFIWRDWEFQRLCEGKG